jgi:tyrosine-protein phosphatase YwqE
VIAHPEANAEVKDDPERVAGLAQQGALVEEAGMLFQ